MIFPSLPPIPPIIIPPPYRSGGRRGDGEISTAGVFAMLATITIGAFVFLNLVVIFGDWMFHENTTLLQVVKERAVYYGKLIRRIY